MLTITVRPAQPAECLNIDVESDADLPDGVMTFDDCDWHAHFFCGLGPGNWVVDIQDTGKILKWQSSGCFHLQMLDDSGFLRRVK